MSGPATKRRPVPVGMPCWSVCLCHRFASRPPCLHCRPASTGPAGLHCPPRQNILPRRSDQFTGWTAADWAVLCVLGCFCFLGAGVLAQLAVWFLGASTVAMLVGLRLVLAIGLSKVSRWDEGMGRTCALSAPTLSGEGERTP